MTDPVSFAQQAIKRLTENIANEMEALADELERRNSKVTGPEALRSFAAGIHGVNNKIESDAS